MNSLNSARSAHGAELVPSSDVLMGIGHELRALAGGVDDIEELVSNLVVAGSFQGSASLYQLQSLDKLRQSLEGIADFLDVLSHVLPNSRFDPSHAAGVVKLAELSRRLSIAAAPAYGSEEEAGEYEAFQIAE